MLEKMNNGENEQDRKDLHDRAWKMIPDFNKLEFIFINLKGGLLHPPRSCWKHIGGAFIFRPNLLDRLDNIK